MGCQGFRNFQGNEDEEDDCLYGPRSCCCLGVRVLSVAYQVPVLPAEQRQDALRVLLSYGPKADAVPCGLA